MRDERTDAQALILTVLQITDTVLYKLKEKYGDTHAPLARMSDIPGQEGLSFNEKKRFYVQLPRKVRKFIDSLHCTKINFSVMQMYDQLSDKDCAALEDSSFDGIPDFLGEPIELLL
ncbi:hypothetical protein COOONC_20443 [Cooperia oncophora]